MSEEVRQCRALWRSAFVAISTDWRKEWRTTQRASIPSEIRTYFASRDGQNMQECMGLMLTPADVEKLVRGVTADEAGPLDQWSRFTKEQVAA